MFKLGFSLFLLICLAQANAQTWSQDEINSIQQFSLKKEKLSGDSTNKVINQPLAISFGKSLFNDKRLSSNQKVSCSSCHIEKHAFTDNRKLAIGLREGFRNTPTLLNVRSQHWFFADGSKDSLWAQALFSIENPAEQNFTRTEVRHLIANIDVYKKQYQDIFAKGFLEKSELDKLPKKAGPNAKLEDLIKWKKLTQEQRHRTNLVFTNIGKAIAAYVSTLKTEPTRFDVYLDELEENTHSEQLNASEQRGLKLFMSQDSGCINCHSGASFSNKSFHNIGTGIPGKDNGRSEVLESVIRDEFNCLSKYSDAKAEDCLELKYINRNKHQLSGSYKTSILRNIGKTAPYMHDGRFETLLEVIDHYEQVSQKKPNSVDLTPINLSDKDKSDLINFLLTL